MPGIHVRSFGKLDWEDRNIEPTLTVPGSYWLCHKNNIYKFTFKFHKTVKNSSNFSYSKELMKIIRRVIKWKPRQGQHFSTTNLLVTYNHASWTRQDKMFAVMKFCDRPNAAAFPNAFILTVKIIDPDQHSEEKMGGISSKPDVEKSTEFVSSVNDSSTNCLPENFKHEKSYVTNSRNSQEEKKNKNEESTWFFRTRSRLKESDDTLEQSSYFDRCAGSSEECPDITAGNSKSTDADSSSENNAENKSCDWMDESEEVFESAFKMQDKNDEKQTPATDDDENSSSSDDTNSDDSSLPYQYLIERDIERENSRIAKKRSEEENKISTAETKNDISIPNNSQVSNFTNSSDDCQNSEKNIKFRSRQNSRDSDSLPPEVTNLRSSNITDLVMKGLMFTIRQDKDTVTVVEQKTKLTEVDEVLENSEKVETKEGDPCLLNSSLLRLEKMITRMQEPVSLPEKRQNGMPENAIVSFLDLDNEMCIKTDEVFNEADIAESKEMCGALETANYWNNFLSEKDFLDSNFDNFDIGLTDSDNKLLSDNEDLVLKMDSSEEEEDEDIIPEALLTDSFQSSQTNSILSTEVSTDDDQVIDKKITNERISTSMSESNQIVSSFQNHQITNSLKTPKILSNQIITNDQIHPALLKALKKSSSHRQDYNEKTSIDVIENSSFYKNIMNVKGNDNVENISDNIKLNSIENDCNQFANKIDTNSITVTHPDSEIKDSKIGKLEKSLNNNIISDSLTSDRFNVQNLRKRVTRSNSNTSNSNSFDNGRRTRSNSKLYENNIELVPEKMMYENEFSAESESQRIFDNETSDVLNALANQSKRRISSDDNRVVKFFKSENIPELEKDVQINVAKLLNDLKYGLQIVIERLDITNIPS